MEARDVLIRPLRSEDIPAAMRLKQAAGWNQTEQDWLNLLELAPEGCLALECDGRVVSTATAVCYGSDLAWIGMVLTAPEYRGRGFARLLMERALAQLARLGIAWIKLDATDIGWPLYRKLGFEEEGPVERWAVQAPVTPARAPAVASHFVLDEALDREAFGADRTQVLRRLARWEAVSLPGCGYAMGRPGSNAFYFGPCVSRTPEAARALLQHFLTRHAGELVFWDILSGNSEALRLAEQFGFECRRRLMRMALRGAPTPPLANNDHLVYGIAGFEYG